MGCQWGGMRYDLMNDWVFLWQLWVQDLGLRELGKSNVV